MNIIKVDCLPLSIFVGYERENDARGVTFDYSAWAEQYGDGVLQLLVQRPGDADPYPVVLTAGENNTAVWLLSATDTAVKGQLEIQLIFTVGSVVAKTAVLPVLVDRSLAAGATPPDPYETWLETLTQLAEQILHTTQPPEIRDGYWYIFDPDTGEYVNSGVKAEGEDGVGITGAQLNADYTLTLSFSDGTSYTTPSIRGAQGEPGPTPQLSIGTVTTGAAGSSAAAEIGGTPEAPVLNFTIPRGDTGEVSEAELQAALLDKADVITDTASGAIASFPDGAAAPVKALTVAVEPVQDLHGYANPWPAGGGVNKLPNIMFQRSSTIVVLGQDNSNNYELALKAGTYTVSVTTTVNGAFYYQPSGGSTTKIGNSPSATFTLAEDTNIRLWYYKGGDGVSVSDLSNPQLELGSSPTAWTPYSNICPISGWSAVGIEDTGVNVWDEETELGILNPDGTIGETTGRLVSKNFIPVVAGKTYSFVWPKNTGQGRGAFYNNNGNLVQYCVDFPTTTDGNNWTFTVPSGASYLKFCLTGAYGTTYNNDISINYPSSDHDYHAYNGTTYPIPLGTTVYGGTLDVVNGKMYARPYYPSYNGETLVGPWVSSVDKYEEGATPTTGAQVVDMGGAVTEISLTPEEIETLKGPNNFWSDAGDVSVEYRADTKLYIEKKITAAIAAALNS